MGYRGITEGVAVYRCRECRKLILARVSLQGEPPQSITHWCTTFRKVAEAFLRR